MEVSLSYILVGMKIMLMVVGIVFFISGVDDLFIDLCYFVRAFYRKIFILPKIKPLSEAQLLSVKEQPIAVMIPAWDESQVIQFMLENTIKTLSYQNFYLFVGAYPNDLKTQAAVERVIEKNPRVQCIVCPHDGPTTKSDCLNWVYQGIRCFEREKSIRFEIFVMQDCEDVIHPLCYKLLNYLIPRNDMVQLPVFSLTTSWSNFTAGHYIDEFAQGHYKDVLVRELLSKNIPAAGVGCGFSRRAFDAIAKSNKNILFSLDSLTEDYDLGIRLKKHKMRQIFVKFWVKRIVMKKNPLTGKTYPVQKREFVCIREFFPSNFWAAVRQKSRWVVGIALQGWEHLGWQGNFWSRYMLYRDRKVLVTNLVYLLGYAMVIAILLFWLTLWLNPEFYRYPSLLEKGSWLWYVTLANLGFFVLRIVQRGYCVYQVYGWRQAFLSFPRMVWGNFINFFATTRAIRLYLRYLVTGKIIAWDKTVHSYPSEEQLLAFRRKLGELLLDLKLITVHQLEEALTRQRKSKRLLGMILFEEMGAITKADLSKVLQMQLGLVSSSVKELEAQALAL